MKRKRPSDFKDPLPISKKSYLVKAQSPESLSQVFFNISRHYIHYFDVDRHIMLVFERLPFDKEEEETALPLMRTVQKLLCQSNFDHLINFSEYIVGFCDSPAPKKIILRFPICINEEKTLKETNEIFKEMEGLIKKNDFANRELFYIDYFIDYPYSQGCGELEKTLNNPISLSIDLESTQKNNQKEHIKKGVQIFYQTFSRWFHRVIPHVVKKIEKGRENINIYLTDSQSCQTVKSIKQTLEQLKQMIEDCLEDQNNFNVYEKNHLMSDWLKRESLKTLYCLTEKDQKNPFPKTLEDIVVDYLKSFT